MAMTNCPECGKQMSNKAAACLACGAPNKRVTSASTWVLAILVGLPLCYYMISCSRAEKANVAAAQSAASRDHVS